MDNHRGLPHDLPEYTPNWPVPVKVKARVYRGRDGLWYWGHSCPTRGLRRYALGHPRPTQPAAFEAALKHVQGCW